MLETCRGVHAGRERIGSLLRAAGKTSSRFFALASTMFLRTAVWDAPERGPSRPPSPAYVLCNRLACQLAGPQRPLNLRIPGIAWLAARTTTHTAARIKAHLFYAGSPAVCGRACGLLHPGALICNAAIPLLCFCARFARSMLIAVCRCGSAWPGAQWLWRAGRQWL